MASFTGKGETHPTMVGTQVKGLQRVGVSDVHGALSRPSPRGCAGKTPWKKGILSVPQGPGKAVTEGFHLSLPVVTRDHTNQKWKVDMSG